MTRRLRHLWMLIATLVVAFAADVASGENSPGGYLGSSSCSNIGCHGAAHPSSGGIRRDEFGIWLNRDAHSGAYSALFEESGRRILDNLLRTSGEDLNPVHARKVWKNCLECHNTTSELIDDAPFTAKLAEGVGCESCHGNAKGSWYHDHFQVAKFMTLSENDKQSAGLNRLDSSIARAETCVRCHVAGTGIVDHDLIAAGHPAMKFELHSYLKAMPPHWRDDHDSTPDSVVREWLAGQIAVATAAIDRVDREASVAASRQGFRPIDLAEHDCDTCHHPLKDRLNNEWGGVKRRTLPEWGTWNLGLLETLTAEPNLSDIALAAKLKTLRESANHGYRRRPEDLKQSATEARELLQAWSERVLTESDENTSRVRNAITRAAQSADHQHYNWDQIAHRYYALDLIAIGPAKTELANVREALRYKEHVGRVNLRAERERVLEWIRSASAHSSP
jgi:hypothetical protein